MLTDIRNLAEQLNKLSIKEMFTNEPDGQLCPFSLLAAVIDDDRIKTRLQDIVYQDNRVIAFINFQAAA